MQDANLNDDRDVKRHRRPARLGLARLGPARLSFARLGLAHIALTRLGQRGRNLGLGLAALVVVGLATAGGPAPGSFVPSGTAASSLGQSVLSRDGGDARADRSSRTTPTAPSSPSPAAPATAAPTPTTPSPPATPKPKPAWVLPMPGAEVTSCFGQRWGVLHAGIDLATPPSTPVGAVGAGVVTDAGWLFVGYGISVVIDHGNGYLTHYAHLKFTTVSPGQRVVTGQMIGAEGSTGDSSGPHLHFEVHQGMWNQVDPAPWLRQRGIGVPAC